MSAPSMYDEYASAFVRRSHELLILGHARLDAAGLNSDEETAITGKLCDAMEAVLDGESRPDWATHLTVVDDQPESVSGKTGKRRPRTDVCVRCINPRPAQRFRFEAKRLNCGSALAEYLGEAGMLALITGYYGSLPLAGMVGYVQTNTCSHWSARIKSEISNNPRDYLAVKPVRFHDLATPSQEPVFCSHHEHEKPGRARTITHTLLLCA